MLKSYTYNGSEHSVLRALQTESSFQRYFPDGKMIGHFSAEKYPFRDQVTEELLRRGMMSRYADLEELHSVVPPEFQVLDGSLQNKVAVAFYDTPSEIMHTYHRFISEFIAGEIFKADVVFQAVPTFRFYFAGHSGYQGPTLYHSDIMLGHPPQEINIWIPLTRCSGVSSLSFCGLEKSLEIMREFDYKFDVFDDVFTGISKEPVKPAAESSAFFEGDVGDCLIFDSRCLHGTPINNTMHTRVSIDTRVMLYEDYKRLDYAYVGSGRRATKFQLGECYDSRLSSQLS